MYNINVRKVGKIMLEKIKMWVFERRVRKLIQKKGVVISHSGRQGKVFQGWFMPDGTDTITFIGYSD